MKLLHARLNAFKAMHSTSILLLLAVFLLPEVAVTDQKEDLPTNRKHVFHRKIALNFMPEDVFFFVDIPGAPGARRIKGVVVPAFSEQAADTDSQEWVVGVPLVLPSEVETFTYAAIIIGATGDYRHLAPVVVTVEEETTGRNSTEELQELLASSKQQLKEWEAQYRAQAESITRLKSDATIIARLERVENVEEQIRMIEEELTNADRDLGNLQLFLRVAKKSSVPRNFARRERELIKQLKELADATTTAENEELSRKAAAEESVQQQLRIVERTRSISAERLAARLKELRSQRQRLELQLGVSNSDIGSEEEYLQ